MQKALYGMAVAALALGTLWFRRKRRPVWHSLPSESRMFPSYTQTAMVIGRTPKQLEANERELKELLVAWASHP